MNKPAETESEITHRRFTSADLPRALEIFTTVFGVSREEKDFEWKYRGYFQPETPAIVLAECEGKTVGMFAAVAMPLSINGELRKGYESVDTAVLPQYRKQGIRHRLHADFLKLMYEYGAYIGFGFASVPHFETGKKHSGYDDLGSFNCYETVLPVAGTPSTSESQLIELPGLEPFRAGLTGLADLLKRQAFACVVRSVEYLSHRYVNHPRMKFRFFGLFKGDRMAAHAVVHIDADLHATIYDCYGEDDPEIANSLFGALVERLAGEGAKTVNCWYRGLPSYVSAMLEQGFVMQRDALLHIGMSFIREIPERESLLKPESWFFTLGDSDL